MEPEEAKKLFLKLSPRRQEIAKLISKGLLKREVARTAKYQSENRRSALPVHLFSVKRPFCR